MRGRAVSFQRGQTQGADHSPCSVEPEGGFYKANPSEGPPVYLGRSKHKGLLPTFHIHPEDAAGR